MNKRYNFIISIALLLGFHYISLAQEINCEELYDLNITTNPDNPVNERHPDFEQQYFDWRTFWYDINWSANTNNQEYSPFYQPDNDIVDHLKDKDDFKPEDGWELINYNLGFDLSGIPIPNPRQSIYLVLYNRYHAKLRVFVLLGEQQGGYSNCRISVRHSQATNDAQLSGVLEGARQYTAPLMEFDGTKKISTTSRHLNNNSSWSYAEFHLTYDPCACLHTNSRLLIEQRLVDVAAITLEGTSSGTLEMLDENNPNNNPDGSKHGFYEHFGGFFEDVDGVVSAGKKSFKTYDKWISALDTADADNDAKSGVSNLLSVLSTGDNALGKGLKTIPYISEAMSIIDFFVGGGESEPETVQMAPMAMELNHSFSGNLETDHPYNDIIFDLPGSSAQPYDGNPANWDQDFSYPHYNKPLGVISILERPKITTAATYNAVLDQSASQILGYFWHGASRYSRRWFQYHGDLEYVVNPESGLEVEEVHAAVVTHLSNTTVDPTDSQHGHPLDPESDPLYHSALSNLATQGEFSGGYKNVQDEVYTSELLPLSCLHNLTLYTHEVYQKWYWAGDDEVTSGHDPTLMNYPSYDGVFLKVVFNMKRIDGNGNNVLLVYQVPMEITDNGNLPESDMGWSTEFADVLESLNRDTLIENETVDEDLYVWRNIEASNTLFNTSGVGQIDIKAGNSIDIGPDSEIRSDALLDIKSFPGPCENNTLHEPLSLNHVLQNHCLDSRYASKSKIFSSSIEQQGEGFKGSVTPEPQVDIYPNPNTGESDLFISIDINGVQDDDAYIDIFSSQGLLLKRIKTNIEALSDKEKIDVANLASGTYLCKISLSNGTIIGLEKFIKL